MNTLMQIVNGDRVNPVTVFVTLGATPGCLQDVSKIPFVTNVIAPLVGWFVLQPGASVGPYAPDSLGFNGNLSFNTQPMNCPTPQFPKGINIFEFIINNGFQAGNPQETVDISCVAGVNCLIKGELIGGHDWNAGASKPIVKLIENGKLYTNTGRVGVFPYGCDNCTASTSPPVCPGHPPYEKPQTEPICNVQRNARAPGGLVKVTYLGNAA
jgi:hypothetical protein